jgi:hypothetical protein
MGFNRRFKDSVFSFLFSDSAALRELYSAIKGIELPPDLPVTINPNMAVRLLMYIARVYEKLTAGKNLYGRKKFTIPRPEFIVLYNGTDPYPDEAVLNLSEAFADASFLGIPRDRPDLELRVKVYNINRGRNEPIIRRCERLNGYSALIAKVRDFEGEIGGGQDGAEAE